jgi:hypothetical protein
MTISYLANQNMTTLLEQGLSHDGSLPRKLTAILQSGFLERNGCIVLRALAGTAEYSSSPFFPDKTCFECFINHEHIDPVPGQDGLLPLRIGLDYGRQIARLLQAAGYRLRFRIILSFDLEQKICTIRFHTRRPNEDWLDGDLDAYKEEAIHVTDVDCTG